MVEAGDLAAWTARTVIAVVLLVAAQAKLWDRKGFLTSLQAYSALPPVMRPALARLLPWIEVAIAALLLSGLWLTWIAVATALLFLAFAAGVRLAFAGKESADCGCFGAGADSMPSQLVARNVALTCLALVILGAELSRLDGLSGLALLVAAIASVAAVLMTLPRRPSASSTGAEVQDGGRRLLMRMGLASTVGLLAATVLGLQKQPSIAEAACQGCGTCGTEYTFLYCVSGCCAVYLVRPYSHCGAYCNACSATSRTYCNIPSCC
jgi:uncharacterized membrane protein YphA (DoxX/SURF4 family)